jgi:fructose-specific component phosphotransferase system IIB-like protein
VEEAECILGESADKKLVGRLVDILAEKETELQSVIHLAQLEKVKAEGEHIWVINTIKAVAEGELKTAKAVAEADSLNKMYVISSAYKKQLSAITIR